MQHDGTRKLSQSRDRQGLEDQRQDRKRGRDMKRETQDCSSIQSQEKSMGHSRLNEEDDCSGAQSFSADMQMPDFRLSGNLAKETNMKNGVALVHSEPLEAHRPTSRWRLYVFKNEHLLDQPISLSQSRYIFGREHRVADVPIDHLSCSKQHAVLQFRLTTKANIQDVRPYLMDLGSTNGTFLNGDKLEPERYYELLDKDVFKFGHSTRDFVLLQER